MGGLGLDLRLRRCRRGAPRGARDGRPVGRVAAAEVAVPRPRRAGRRRLLLHERHRRASRSARCATARSATSAAACSATAPSTTRATTRRAPRRHGALDRRRPLPQRSADKGFDVEVVERTGELPHLQLQGPQSRELLASLTDTDLDSLRYFRFLEHVTVGGVPGCLDLAHRLLGRAGLRDLHLARERRAALERAARPGPVARACARTASRPSSRCASSRA